MLPWIRKYANLIVARTFSKAAGLAGLRIGCLFARQREILAAPGARANRRLSQSTRAALIGVEASIRDGRVPEKYDAGDLARSRTLRARTHAPGHPEFSQRREFPSCGFRSRSASDGARALEKQGILLRERKDFPREGFVRVTVGTQADTRRLLRAIEALR